MSDEGDHPAGAAIDGLPEDVDPDLLARWITIAGLLDMASTMLSRGQGGWPRMGLVAADTAAEAVLGLLGSGGPRPPNDRARFEEVLESAALALRDRNLELPAGLRSRLIEGHRLRNNAVHHGSEPTPSAVNRHIRAAEQLRDVAIASSPFLGVFAASGPVRAVARLIDRAEIGEWLEHAVDLGALVDRAGAAAIALDVALGLLHPALRPPSWPTGILPSRGFGSDVADVRLREVFERSRKATDRHFTAHETWLIAMAVGLAPAELADIQRTLGRPARYLDGHVDINRDPAVVLTDESVERAVLAVADMVFRMWAAGSFRPEGVNQLFAT